MPSPRNTNAPNDMWSGGTSGLITRIAIVAALAGLLFGFDTGVISGALDYIGGAFHLSDIGKSTVVSAVLLGAVIAASNAASACPALPAASEASPWRNKTDPAVAPLQANNASVSASSDALAPDRAPACHDRGPSAMAVRA